MIKAAGNRLYIRNNSTLLHITPLFITMATDKSTTGYRDSEEMNSFIQQETHVSWEASVLVGVIFLDLLFSISQRKLDGPMHQFYSAKTSEIHLRHQTKF